MAKLLLGTLNRGKQDELSALLSSPSLEILTPQDLDLDIQIRETGDTYAENASLKAAAFASQSGLWTLSDDSGLEVEVLDGGPGLRSARLGIRGEPDSYRRQLLLELLKDHPRPWKARFRSTVALANPSGGIEIAEGQCDGEIIGEERGAGGFGYDRIFMIHGTGKTMAELNMAEKNKISHRARAVEHIRPALNTKLGLSAAS